MLPLGPNLQPSSQILALPCVIDSCMFGRRAWMELILSAARAGQIAPLWSPCIISEVGHLMTWLWLKRAVGLPSDC